MLHAYGETIFDHERNAADAEQKTWSSRSWQPSFNDKPLIGAVPSSPPWTVILAVQALLGANAKKGDRVGSVNCWNARLKRRRRTGRQEHERV
jgi:hypothetical protein